MKLLPTLIMLTISLCAGFCCPKEDDYDTTTYYVENNTIIQIEDNKNVFNLGDRLYITVSIEDQQITIDNEDVILSDFVDITNSDEAYVYNSFILYKETGYNTLSKILIKNDDLEVIKGNLSTYDEFIQVVSTYDDDKFISEFSFPLLENGTFYLSGSSLDYYEHGGVNLNIGTEEKGFISIMSNIINSNEKNLYKFTVN